jgi:hypothetical protein
MSSMFEHSTLPQNLQFSVAVCSILTICIHDTLIYIAVFVTRGRHFGAQELKSLFDLILVKLTRGPQNDSRGQNKCAHLKCLRLL